jgi:hypothetical protein
VLKNETNFNSILFQFVSVMRVAHSQLRLRSHYGNGFVLHY